MTTPPPGLAAALSDRYRIERELGQGGMATVYLAHDLKHDRQVAIKVLRPELAAVIGAERFVHEITTTADLQHPNILPLFDSGQRRRLPLLRHAVRRGRDAARPAGTASGSCRSTRASRSRRRWPPRWPTRTNAASSTATSSPTTSCSRAGRRWSPTSASPAPSTPPAASSSPRPAWRSAPRRT